MAAKMKTIAITAYKRPQYFEQLLSSLIKNDLHDWEIYIQLEPSNKEKYFFEIAERLLKSYSYFIGVNPYVLGIRDNPYHMLDKVFISGALCCIYLEEDLIISPDVTRIANWYLRQDHKDVIALNLISGGCNSAGFISNPAEMNTFIKTNRINSLGLIFTDHQWEQHLKSNWHKKVEHTTSHNGILFEGWDLSLYDYLLSHSDLHALQPVFSRVIHISEENTTHTTREFQKKAFMGLGIYEGPPLSEYIICNDFYSFPYPLRSHLNLWQELTEALVLLKKSKKTEAGLEINLKNKDEEIQQLQMQLTEVNYVLEKTCKSKSWRLTFFLRWFNLKYKSILSSF